MLKTMGSVPVVEKTRRGLRRYSSSPDVVLIPTSTYMRGYEPSWGFGHPYKAMHNNQVYYSV